MLNKNCIVCSALYAKKDWEKYGGYDTSDNNGYEDWDFWLNFIEDGKEFYRIDETLFFYRRHENSHNYNLSPAKVKTFHQYICNKHASLAKYQAQKYIPIFERIKLLAKKYFIPKIEYQHQKNKHEKHIVSFVNPPRPLLIMTLLVKNEEDILEENLIFHKQMGVDAFIITDNMSDDKTPQIIEKYKQKGWILESITETSQDFSQAEWVHRMDIIARNRYHADWIINADADEFWYSDKNIKESLNVQNNKIFVPIFTMLSQNEDWKLNTQKVIRNFPKKLLKNLQTTKKLSKFNQFSVSIPKIIIRASDYKMIHMGNHNCDMIYNCEKLISNSIQIFHFNIRGLAQFKQKMITGGAAYERNKKLGKNVGNHWRYFYEGYKNGTLNLNQEYLKATGALITQEIKKYHITTTDNHIKNFFIK